RAGGMRRFLQRKSDHEGRSFSPFAPNVERSAVALHTAADHGKSEARTTFALGGEERFKAMLANLFSHSSSIVDDLEDGGVLSPKGSQSERSAFGHGIDGV